VAHRSRWSESPPEADRGWSGWRLVRPVGGAHHNRNVLKRYRFRAYPTGGQEQALARVFGCARVVFNDVIAARNDARTAGLKMPSAGELSKRLLTNAKATPERAWLAEVSAVPLQQALADADRAYRNFFNSLSGKRKGRLVGSPRFKSRRDHRQSVRFTNNAGYKVTATSHGVGFLTLPKIGRVRFNLSRALPSDPSSVSIIREADGRYYVSFVVDVGTTPLVPTNTASGIDLGLTDLAAVVSADGTREKVANPRYLRRKERSLARAQRALSRKQKGSQNRAKARIKVAILHRRVRETRLDHHHKLARRLVHENQVVAVEGLSISGLARTRMARSIQDAGWGILLRLLAEKADQYDRAIITIGQWEPTSQVCSVCGVKDGKKPLSVRVWACGGCSTVLDRDYNAAVNIMVAAGLAETLNARGGNIRLALASAVPDEAGTRRTDPSHPVAAA